MGQQLANGDVLLTVDSEFGQIFGHRIIQAKAALLVKLHDGRCRNQNLGQRGKVEDGVFCHRLGRGMRELFPYALWKMTRPLWPAITTAPGSFLASMPPSMMRSICRNSASCAFNRGARRTRSKTA